MPEEVKLEEGVCQVLLCSSPASLPFAMFPHFWFVVNRGGMLSRWEILWDKRELPNAWGHLYLNDFAPFEGMGMVLPLRKPSWKGRVRAVIEGADAVELADYIENTPKTYPAKDGYFAWGPNSNTFIAWVLKKFPKIKWRLPWNAVGKGATLPSSL